MNEQKQRSIANAIVYFFVFNVILGFTSLMGVEGDIFNAVLMIVATSLPLAAIALKHNFKSSFLEISVVIFFVFWICFIIQFVIKERIVNSAENKVELLDLELESFKELNGEYPSTLDFQEFSNLDLSHFLNSKIQYDFTNDTSYVIKFPSFNQSFRIYDSQGIWYSDD